MEFIKDMIVSKSVVIYYIGQMGQCFKSLSQWKTSFFFHLLVFSSIMLESSIYIGEVLKP